MNPFNNKIPLPVLLNILWSLLLDFALPSALFIWLLTYQPYVEATAPLVESVSNVFLYATVFILQWCVLCDLWFVVRRYGKIILSRAYEMVMGILEAVVSISEGSVGSALITIVKSHKHLIGFAIALSAGSALWSALYQNCPEDLRPLLDNATGVLLIACIVGPVLAILISDISSASSSKKE